MAVARASAAGAGAVTITAEQMRSVTAPFNVRRPGHKRVSTITGFSRNDPLGVGGGIFPDMPTAYFEGGGWLLVKDMMRHYELVEIAPDAKKPPEPEGGGIVRMEGKTSEL